MNKKRKYFFDITLGVIGLMGTVALMLFTTQYENLDILLFLLLLISGGILERIKVTVGEFAVSLDIAVMMASYFLLGIVPTLWLLIFFVLVYGVIFDTRPFVVTLSNTGMFTVIFIITHFVIVGVMNIYTSQSIIYDKLMVVFFGLNIFILNWTVLLGQIKLKGDKLPESLGETIRWDLYSYVVVIPLSILLIDASNYYGYKGLIILCLIIIGANILFKLLRNLVFINNELRVVHEVSLSISSKLDLTETTNHILKGINKLVNCDYCCVLHFDKTDLSVKVLNHKNFEDIDIDIENIKEKITESLDKLLEYKKSFIIENIERNNIKDEVRSVSKDIKSFIYEPLTLEDDIIGCVLIISSRANSFDKSQLNILDILSNQAVIAIENAKLYREAKNKAIMDNLTGLYNQKYFFDTLNVLTNKCSSCERKECIQCNRTSLVILDIDHFKRVNDTYGHQTGDKILSEVGNIIKSNVRNTDIVARYGGEEFTIILPRTDERTAYEIANRIRESIENRKFRSMDGHNISVTISGGVSEYPRNADSASTLLSYADRAMYTGAKRKGRNRISVYAS
ncbi:sensor domain-containing diguanylate cyclase [Dethiothermospora halolimnae]|uniref:sensor domain-containing diguanylate cyclase n=1 Tax=Dethiothermospora halolimnae TaxID=3114390 RepID=UPI003CCBE449